MLNLFGRGQLRRQWLVVFSLCALFSIAAAAGWSADVKQVSNINPTNGAYPYLPTAIGDDLYFYANAGPDHQLFRTRGDETVQLTNIYSDSIGLAGDYTPYLAPARAGASIFFASMQMATDAGVRPYEIWRVNEASPGGAELYWRSTELIPLGWAQAGDLLYIRMRNGSSDELWVTDGGSGGLQLAKAGLASKWGAAFKQVGSNAAYFEAFTSAPFTAWYWRAGAGGVTPLDTLGVSGSSSAIYQDDFYVTNGTRVVRVPAGSTQGELVFEGGWVASIQELHAVGDKLFLIDAQHPLVGPEFVLWRYAAAQKQLERIGAYSRIVGMAAVGDSAYFVTAGAEDTLMRLPATSSAAVEVTKLTGANLADGNSPNLAAGSTLLYLQVAKDNGWELWASDGAAAGTRPLSRIWDYAQDAQFNNCPCITVAGDTLYFDKLAAAKSVEMWRVKVAEDHPLYLPHVVKP